MYRFDLRIQSLQAPSEGAIQGLVDISWSKLLRSLPSGWPGWEVNAIADESLEALLHPKPVLQASLFCNSVGTDDQGRLTIAGTFHTLAGGPAPEFVMVNLWRYDALDSLNFREMLEMRDPDGRTLGELRTSPFKLGGEDRCRFSYVRFTAVNLAARGCHEVRIALVDTATHKVIVTAVTPLEIV